MLRVAPLRLEPRSKAERGYKLAAHEDGPAKAVHAVALDVHVGLSAETVLRRVGRACLDHLLRNEDAALAGDADGIHQMRVAVRRLRAVLSAFAPLLPKEQRRCRPRLRAALVPPMLSAMPATSMFFTSALAAAGASGAAGRQRVRASGSWSPSATAARRRPVWTKAIVSTRYT